MKRCIVSGACLLVLMLLFNMGGAAPARGAPERAGQGFASPEECFQEYVKAVTDGSWPRAAVCFRAAEGGPGQESLKHFRTVLPLLDLLRRTESLKDPEGSRPVPLSVQPAGENEAMLQLGPEWMDTGKRKAALILLFYLAGIEPVRGDKVWVPFLRSEDGWRMDADRLLDKALATSPAEVDARRCRGNLIKIGRALLSWAGDHEGRLPPDLQAVLPYLGDADIFRCPGDRSLQKITSLSPGTRMSYVYAGEMDTARQQAAQLVIVYDASPANHGGLGRNVLFLNGRVSWLLETPFQELLRRQAALLQSS